MRLFELMIIVINLTATGVMIFGKRKRHIDLVLLSSIVFIVLLHGIIEHFRLQLIPAYVVGLVLGVVFIFRIINEQKKTRRQSRVKKCLAATLVLAATAVCMYLNYLLPVFSMPAPTGKYAVGTISQHLKDETREEILTTKQGDKRELMINVWYPVNPEAAKQKTKEHYPSELGEAISLVFDIPKQLFSHVTMIPTHVVTGLELSKDETSYPVLLFSPGVRSTRFQSMTAIEELVSHGYIVVGIDHPITSAKVSFPDGKTLFYKPGPEFTTSAEVYENNIKGISIRTADASFVLDTLTEWNKKNSDSIFEGKLDLNRVGIFGHSYGGATTAETLAQDKRFKAGVSLEGGFWGSVAHAELQQPFMYMMSGKTAESFDPSATIKDKVFYEEFSADLESVMDKSKNDTYYLTVDHFFHQSFTDLALISPSIFAKNIDPVHNIDITRSYVRAFFDQYLKGEHQTLLEGPSSKFPEVSFDKTFTKKK
ncbi:alpha/beta hydrolase family protein [Bacillus chungangensis]|uniref:Dienelactone hydrolase n=1 Tax=Bacillus chungangensis TaxID=587633 RepID=A0ABT9WP87_9BACI|nr:prolyl oligopeptidase family serine peptidase [Bacillus chungangensis]MDQ0175101.1 putative dienelactone hydrolase [Bacillus chungangensis]